MKTLKLKELQEQVSELQNELEMRTALCALVPEKYAMCFKPTYIDSGYSMGEVIFYTCNGKEFYKEDNRRYYTGRGAKYTPAHGKIYVNFTKKALLEYCKLCYNIQLEDMRKNYNEAREIACEKKGIVTKCISQQDSKVKYIYVGL